MEFLFALALCSYAVNAATPEDVPTILCQQVTQAPVIDGKLDDPAWQQVQEMTPFRLTTTGEIAKWETSARICWDNERLYVAFNCKDENIHNHYLKRDDPIYNEEVVEIFVQPKPETRRYYEFNLSPRNIVFDAFIGTGSPEWKTSGTAKWNCKGFKTAVVASGTIEDPSDTDQSWQAEMSIPFKSMKQKTPKPGETWRANLFRIEHSDVDEFQAWSPTGTPFPAFHVASRFARLSFQSAK